jgi:hypothetical protein
VILIIHLSLAGEKSLDDPSMPVRRSLHKSSLAVNVLLINASASEQQGFRRGDLSMLGGFH